MKLSISSLLIILFASCHHTNAPATVSGTTNTLKQTQLIPDPSPISVKDSTPAQATKTIPDKNQKIAETNQEQIKYLTHHDKINGYQIDYPMFWDQTIKNSGILFMVMEVNKSNPNDRFSENFNITIDTIVGLTLDSIIEQNKNAINQVYDIKEFKASKAVNKNGIAYARLAFTQVYKGVLLTSYSILFLKESLLYKLSFTTQPDQLPKYDPIYNYIIDSFNWI